MKNISIVMILLFFISTLFSTETVFNKLEEAYKNNEINLDEMILNKFYYIFEKDKLNKKYFKETLPIIKCATLTIMEYQNVKSKLNSTTQKIVDDYLKLSLETQSYYISPHEYFKISYSTTGPDAVPPTDANENGTPDFVEWIANYLDTSWEVLIIQCGFIGPYDTSGDRYFNISFEEMGTYGYTTNRFVDGNEGYRIVLNNDFLGFPPNQDPEGNQKGAAKVTCAHELKHASQYQYSTSEGRWTEVDAPWAEEMVFDYVNDAMLNLTGYGDPFSNPDWAIDHNGNPNYEDYFWEDFLHQKFDNNSYTSAPILKAFWERREDYPTEAVLNSYDFVLQQAGSSLADAFTEYFTWNFYTGNRAVLDDNGNSMFGYDEAGVTGFPQAVLKNYHNSYPSSGSGSGIEHLAGNYIRLNPGNQTALKIIYNGQNGIQMNAVVTSTNDSWVKWQKINLDGNNDGNKSFPIYTYGALISIFTGQTGSDYSYSYQVVIPPQVNISFTNKINSSAAGGSFILENNSNDIITSGTSRPLIVGYPYNVETQNERFLNWGGTNDYKHHDWNINYQEFKLNHDFNTTFGNQDANSYLMNPAIIETYLISAGGNTTGFIDFHDPWYVDENGNQLDDYQENLDSPHYPKGKFGEIEGGVFLDQGWPNWNPPFYSVRIMQTQTIPFHGQNITWYFQGWIGDPNKVAFQYPNQTETAVVFKAGDAIAQANYKGHGASSSATATGYNNSRRMACYAGTPVVYHMVYGDNNGIWYTSTNNGGQTWIPEVLISQINTENNKNPSIALATNGSNYILYVTWEQSYMYPPGEDQYLMSRILLRKIYVNPSSGAIDLDVIQNISNDTFDSQAEARPAVWAEANDKIWITWKAKQLPTPQNPNPVFKIYMRYFSSTWYPTGEVCADNGFPVITRSTSGYYRTKIIWSDGVKIKYIAGDYGGPWTSIITLIDEPPMVFYQPTFAIDNNNYGYMVYCGYHIYYKKYNLANPAAPAPIGSTLALDTYNCYSPSISVGATGSPVTVFHEKYGVIYRKKYQNGQWTNTNFADGKYPSLAEKRTSGAAWTRFSSAPYILKTDLGDGVLHKGTGPLEEECIIAKRFEFPVKDQNNPDTRLILDLDNFSVNGISCQFNDYLETDQITLSGSNKIVMQWQVQNMDLQQNMPLMRLYFETETEKYFLQTVNSAELLSKSSEQLQTSINTVDFTCTGGLTGRMAIEFIDTIPYHVCLLKGGEGDGTLAKTSTADDINLIIPKEFSLKQNFPNPFNPITQISYELPKACNVSLKIYNTNGQLVADLVNGFKEAGRYQVVFAGAHLASGIYFYRLEAGKFSDVKRMVLIK